MSKMFYYERTYHERGYNFTEIVVFGARRRTLQGRLEGAIYNRDGYGTDEAVESVAKRAEKLIGMGYTHIAEFSLYEPRVRFVWQHYGSDDYCTARTEMGNSIEDINRSLPVLRKISKLARKAGHNPRREGPMSSSDIERPEFVLRAIKRIKITRVERVHGEQAWDIDNVYKAA